MKKLLINICLLLLTVGLSCCYKDKGNYDYSSLPRPVISGIPETCTAYVNTQLQIPVTLEWPDGELKDVSYEWRVNNKVISTEKDLDIIVTLDVKPGQCADFSVIDNESGVRTMKTFVMNVTTELAAGWFVLSNESDYSNLSFIREGDGLLYNNIYETANGEKLTKGVTVIKEHWLPWSEATGEVFIGLPHGPNYSLDLDGNSLKRIVYTKDEFLEGMPDNFAPTNMECVMNWDYLFSNGKLYKRYVERGSDANYNEGKFVRMPEPGDYELSNLTLRGNLVFSTDIIAFDLKTKSYKLIRNGEMQDFNYKDDSGKKFNPNNMGKTLIAGGVTSTDTPTDKFITILKGDDGNYYVHNFKFSGWGKKMYTSENEREFPEPSLIKEDTKWAICKDRPYVYFTSGNDIYVYNYSTEGNTVKKLGSCHFDRPIKAIALYPIGYELLAVAVENSSDSSKSDFMLLNVSVVGDGAIVEGSKKEAVFGDVSMIVYKAGNQWTLSGF